jgi:hypothetical protein
MTKKFCKFCKKDLGIEDWETYLKENPEEKHIECPYCRCWEWIRA